jgi:hypothetical protein
MARTTSHKSGAPRDLDLLGIGASGRLQPDRPGSTRMDENRLLLTGKPLLVCAAPWALAVALVIYRPI